MNIPRNLSDIKLTVANFNGWQRLFVLVAVIWAFFCVATYHRAGIFIPDDAYAEGIKQNLSEKKLPNPFLKYLTPIVIEAEAFGSIPPPPVGATMDLSEVVARLSINVPEKGIKQFWMRDGTLVLAHEAYSQDDIQNAYTKIKNFYRNKITEAKLIGIASQFSLFLFPLLALYVLGWMLGWIYRGFRQQ